MNSTTDTLKSIAAEPPRLETSHVASVVAEQFGLVGDYVSLVSERDQNFRLTTPTKERFVVKVTSLVEEPVVTDFQIAALIHLQESGIQGVPRIVRTTAGSDRGSIAIGNGREACLRVVTWLDGRMLVDSDVTPDVARSLGHRLAELDLAFRNFAHEGDRQVLLWDTQRAGELRSILVHVDDRVVREQLDAVLDAFDRSVKPALNSLPTQVIHNDGHAENILLDANNEVCGIIDFGDMLRAPRIIEVSTAAAYLRTDAPDPLELIAPFVSAYHSRNPISAVEVDLLFDLIRTRQAMTLILFYWRLMARDENDSYRQKLLETENETFDFLRHVSNLGRTVFRDRMVC